MFEQPSKKEEIYLEWAILINFVEVHFFIIQDPILRAAKFWKQKALTDHHSEVTANFHTYNITFCSFKLSSKTGVTLMSHYLAGGLKTKMCKVKQYDFQKIT